MAAIARHLTIRGRVQGVSYRDWTVKTARALGLCGWVRNRTDGSVEAMVIGPEEEVARFIALARSGPPAAAVAGIEERPCDAQPMTGFEKWPTV